MPECTCDLMAWPCDLHDTRGGADDVTPMAADQFDELAATLDVPDDAPGLLRAYRADIRGGDSDD